jgi:phasin family protein
MTANYNFAEMFKNSFDFNQGFSIVRRNIEAASEATKVCAEGAQAISRRQAEVIREGVEDVLKASKDILTSGTPENNLTKQSELAKSIFETALANLREISETATKFSFEAFDVLNKRAAESLEEISSAAGSRASAAKKKASA